MGEQALPVGGDQDHKTQPDVAHLPLEIVVHIMHFLSLTDRQNAGLTCRHWYEASRDVQFLKKERFVVKHLYHDISKSLNVLETSNTIYYCFEFQEVEFGFKTTRFWEVYCPEIRDLRIINCDISSRTLVSILLNSHQLESVSLECCRELFMSGRVLDNPDQCRQLANKLVKLRSLSLAQNRYLSDNLFNRFVSIAQNLEEFSVMGCQVSFHPGLFKKFYPTESYEIAGSESVLTFNNILRYIQSQASKLKRIDLSNTFVDSKALSQLAQVPDLRLNEINLERCDQLTNPGINELVKYQKHLTVLKLSQCIRLTDLALTAICEYLPNLRVLHLSRCRAITNASLPEIGKLEYLEELNLSHIELATGSSAQGITQSIADDNKCVSLLVSVRHVPQALCRRVNPRFRKLSVTALRLDETAICSLARCLPGLRYLDAGFCIQALTDRALQMICQHLIWLRTLRLCACEKITDGGITGMGTGASSSNYNLEIPSTSNCKSSLSTSNNIHHISLRSRAEEEIVKDALRKKEVSNLCEEHLLALENSGQSLPRIKGLFELDLSTCNRISDVSLKYSFSFQELRILNLSRCQQISNVGLSYIGLNNPSIEKMILAHCYNISDEGVASLLTTLTRLRHLDLEGCTKLTDRTCELANLRPGLLYLNVSQCPGISLEAAEACNLRLVLKSGLVTRDLAKAVVSSFPPPPPPPTLKGFKFFLGR